MLHLCVSFSLINLIASGSILTLAAMWLVKWKASQGQGQVDENERIIIQFSILAAFALLVFLFFVFVWRRCYSAILEPPLLSRSTSYRVLLALKELRE